MLTEKQKEKYLDYPKLCPFCGSDVLGGDSFEHELGGGWKVEWCYKCRRKWQNIYSIVDIHELFETIDGKIIKKEG